MPLSKVLMSHELYEEEKGVDFFKKSRIRPLLGVMNNISFTETQVARQLDTRFHSSLTRSLCFYCPKT